MVEPSAARRVSRRLGLLVLLALVAAAAPAAAQGIFNTNVPARAWKAVRVRNVPRRCGERERFGTEQ